MKERRLEPAAVALLATVMLAILCSVGYVFGGSIVLAESSTSSRPGASSGLAEDEGKAVIAIEPASSLVSVGDTFTVTARVYAGPSPVDVVEAHIDFNPKVLQVVTLVFGTALPEPVWWLGDLVDNEQGRVAYGAAQKLGVPGVTGTFELVSIQFRAMRPSVGTVLSFSDDPTRVTVVVSEFYPLPLRMENAEVVISTTAPTPTATATVTPTATSTEEPPSTPTPSPTPDDAFPLKLILPLVLRGG